MPNRLKEKLSPRQWEVAREIALGYSEKEIADRLCVSVDTVHSHARRIRKAINGRSIADVTREFVLSLDNARAYFSSVVCLLTLLFGLAFNTARDIRKPIRTRIPANTVRVRCRISRPVYHA